MAPAQHELAPIYSTTNIATDHNQLTMEIMQKVALKHGLVCLLHEKPFAGVNGSGKHNNWSIATNTGVNLLSPGETPYEMPSPAVPVRRHQAVDDYQDLLLISVATAGNDTGWAPTKHLRSSHFLATSCRASGCHETEPPTRRPAQDHEAGCGYPAPSPGHHRPHRTSPFAFTGNKFEFRMLGSSNSIACANIMLNAAVAESLKIYADRLEGAEDFETALHAMIKKTIKDHKRILFNGNGYDAAWIKEATEVRGLCNYPTTPDCMPHLLDKKNVDMLTSHKVFSVTELESRTEIMLENYSKTVVIEANTMVDMARKQILPARKVIALSWPAPSPQRRPLPPPWPASMRPTCDQAVCLTDQIAGRTDDLGPAFWL